MCAGVARPPSRRASTPPIKNKFRSYAPIRMDVSLRNNIRSLECAGQIKNRMEEKRIFDLVLVKYGLFLVNCGNILVKCGRFVEIFGIDVNYVD